MKCCCLLGVILVANPVYAADCGRGNSSLLTVKSWSAKAGDYSSTLVEIVYSNNSDKQIRMLKASAVFVDPFGDDIARLALEPDVVIPPKSEHVEKGSWSAARLAKIRPEDAEALICVSGVLYEDGTKDTFE